MPGTFFPFFLPYAENGLPVSAEEQASRIIAEARKLLNAGAPGFAITCSANYGQTMDIRKAYSTGEWHTGISGANQAEVMRCMESLLEKEPPALRDKIRIAPITTMTYSGFGAQTHEQVVRNDLSEIGKLLESGWMVAGWVNQRTDPDYAVGGGIARLSDDISTLIQKTLQQFSLEFPLSR
jgi:hypothetical protein